MSVMAAEVLLVGCVVMLGGMLAWVLWWITFGDWRR